MALFILAIDVSCEVLTMDKTKGEKGNGFLHSYS